MSLRSLLISCSIMSLLGGASFGAVLTVKQHDPMSGAITFGGNSGQAAWKAGEARLNRALRLSGMSAERTTLLKSIALDSRVDGINRLKAARFLPADALAARIAAFSAIAMDQGVDGSTRLRAALDLPQISNERKVALSALATDQGMNVGIRMRAKSFK